VTAKTYGSEVARAQLRTLIDEAITGKAESIIERHGKPAAVLISYDRWLKMENERERKRKRIAEARADFQTGNYYTLDQVKEMFRTEGLL
jgi:prevent-host-death family protein